MRNDSGRALVVLQILEKIVIQLLWLTMVPFFWVVSFCCLSTHVFFVVKLLLYVVLLEWLCSSVYSCHEQLGWNP